MNQSDIVIHPQLLEMINSIVIAAGTAIAGMAGAFFFIVKWLMTGLDKRDKTNTEALEVLQDAVQTWKTFEADQKLVNGDIQKALTSVVTQLKILNHDLDQEEPHETRSHS